MAVKTHVEEIPFSVQWSDATVDYLLEVRISHQIQQMEQGIGVKNYRAILYQGRKDHKGNLYFDSVQSWTPGEANSRFFNLLMTAIFPMDDIFKEGGHQDD